MIGFWEEKRVERLKRLWAEGLTAPQIAGHFAGATRCSILGKAHRLGLPPRTKGARKPVPPKTPAAVRRARAAA